MIPLSLYKSIKFALILKNETKDSMILKEVVTDCGTRPEFMMLIPKGAYGFKLKTLLSEKTVLKKRIRTD